MPILIILITRNYRKLGLMDGNLYFHKFSRYPIKILSNNQYTILILHYKYYHTIHNNAYRLDNRNLYPSFIQTPKI